MTHVEREIDLLSPRHGRLTAGGLPGTAEGAACALLLAVASSTARGVRRTSPSVEVVAGCAGLFAVGGALL